MNLDDLANLAEIISGIAVVVTLIFLVVQLRDNTKALRANAVSTHYTDGMDVTADGSRIPELAIALQKAFKQQSLSDEDIHHFNNYILRICGLMERHLLDMREGLLDRVTFDRSVLPGKSLLRTPAGRASYGALKRGQAFGPEIAEYIDNYYGDLDREAGKNAAPKEPDNAD